MLNRSRDTIGIEEWVSDSSIIPASQKRRERVLDKLAKVNGCQSPSELLEKILAEEITAYSASLALVNDLRKREYAPLTIEEYRSTLPVFFESVLGYENFNRRTFDRLVPRGDKYVLRTKKTPTIEELKRTLLIAKPRDRALLGFLSVTGCRISEALSRRVSDIEERKGYARVNFQARSTKSRTKRYAFITQEVLDWIRAARNGITSEFVFPGKGNVGPTHTGFKPTGKDKSLSRNAANVALDELFERAELHDSEDEIFSPHSMRTFADSIMARCGLDRKFIALIISHKSRLAAEANYADWREIEEQWVEKCLERFTWKINEPTYQIVKELTPEAQKAIADLEVRLKKVEGDREKAELWNQWLDYLINNPEFTNEDNPSPLTVGEVFEILKKNRLKGSEQKALPDKSDTREN